MNPGHINKKKALKKQKKFVARMKDSKGIICTDTPCANIVLCNEGQATGLTKERIHNAVTTVLPQIPVPKYFGEKGESYSFLTFNSMENAKLFYEKCNGVWKIIEEGPPLYMIYVDNVPSRDIICQATNPEGLLLIENFITKEEEDLYIKLFDWSEETDSNNLKNRQVKHYGYEFRYGSNDVDLTAPLNEKIPQECDILWSKLKDVGVEVEERPDQLTVNKYQPGQGIPSHVDKHSPFGDTILSLSLGSSVVMDWRHHSGKYAPVVVPGRSLLLMSGEARYDWQHGIQPRTWDPLIETRPIPSSNNNRNLAKVITTDTVKRSVRISLTFRWTRSGPCECVYKTLCDSVSYSTDDIEDDLASDLEDLHVHQVYEQIAEHFSSTRHKAWPRVADFLADVTPGAVLLDLGCGNGKNMLRRGDVLQLGCERSGALLAACARHTRDAGAADHLRMDLLAAPLRDACADIVLCIAVIHHFSSKARRLQAVRAVARVLRRGGRALLTVWARQQASSRYLATSRRQASPRRRASPARTVGGLSLPVHENRTQFQHNDLLVPWKLKGAKDEKVAGQPESTLLRYYHVFEEHELEGLCREAGMHVESGFYEEGNWCVVCTNI